MKFCEYGPWFWVGKKGRHDIQLSDTQHIDIQHNSTQHKGLICDTQQKQLHKQHSADNNLYRVPLC
jgi:hypothetical protein